MRQIGTLSDLSAARKLADYLLTQRIETKLEQQADGWEIWVCDEDRVAQAKEELTAFTANPEDPRFANASRVAGELRRAEAKAEETYRRRQVVFNERFRSAIPGRQPMTVLLIAACIIVAVFTDLGGSNSELKQQLFIAPFQAGSGYTPGLRPIAAGQVWRLVTPIFLHFGILHLLFNMLWLHYLGNEIEARRGSLRYLALVLAIAVASNLSEYFLGGLHWQGGQLVWNPMIQFGGMSGVVFGLFGYILVKMRFEPNLGLALSQQVIILNLFWFAWCFTGLAGSIANVVHTVGLATGMIISIAPTLWHRLWR